MPSWVWLFPSVIILHFYNCKYILNLAFTFGSILLSFIAESKSYAFMYRFSALFIVILLVAYGISLFINSKQEEADNDPKLELGKTLD